MKKKTQALIKLLIFIFALITVFSAIMLVRELIGRQNDIATYNEIYALATTPIKDADNEASESLEDNTEGEVTKPVINLPILIEQNPDCIGWVSVGGTPINYPVMHTPNEVQKYLYKSFYGKESRSGVPFLDERCKLSSDNLIIYGHNMLNGTMFAGLKSYLSKSFCDENPTIELITLNEASIYEIYAVVLTKADDLWYYYLSENEESDFNYLIYKLEGSALYTTDLTPDINDKFITLSTCYGRSDDDRLIVIGIKK